MGEKGRGQEGAAGGGGGGAVGVSRETMNIQSNKISLRKAGRNSNQLYTNTRQPTHQTIRRRN